jgi:hypothetical protein
VFFYEIPQVTSDHCTYDFPIKKVLQLSAIATMGEDLVTVASNYYLEIDPYTESRRKGVHKQCGLQRNGEFGTYRVYIERSVSNIIVVGCG